MLTSIKDGRIYMPEPFGFGHVLILGEKIVYICSELLEISLFLQSALSFIKKVNQNVPCTS